MSERPWVSHANLAYSSFQRCSTTSADVAKPASEVPEQVLALGCTTSQIRFRCRTSRSHWLASGTALVKTETRSGRLVLQRRFFDLVSYGRKSPRERQGQQGYHGSGQVAMKRCSRSLSSEASL